jgi:hypothetical protein
MDQMHYLPLTPGFFAILVGFFDPAAHHVPGGNKSPHLQSRNRPTG